MAALKPTAHVGVITWLGLVRDREQALASDPVAEITARFSGPEGEAHGGLTRPSCGRVIDQYPRGTTIRNTRQFSILSAEELAEIAAELGIDGLSPALMGATMVLSGIPDFTHLPPSSRLQAESGATLVVDMENRPCNLPAPGVEAAFPGKGKRIKQVAQNRRGVTAWVEREGLLRLGDKMVLHIPDQRAWSP
ncbi:MAG: sulfurase [Paracoccaceae bacterium]